MGGAIFNMFGGLIVVNSTLSGNNAQGGAEGSLIAGAGGSGYGGALFNLDGTATITYVTVANNSAIAGAGGPSGFGGIVSSGPSGNADGSGVYNLAYGNNVATGAANTATLTINNCVIGQNTGGSNLVNDSEKGNNSNNTGNTAQINGSSSVVQGGATQITAAGTSNKAAGVTVTSAPNLATTLANKGGLTETLAPNSGSPVAGAGDGSLSGLPTVDQRGLPRPSIAPDDGAFQTQNIATTTTVRNLTTTYTSAGMTVQLAANVDAYGLPVAEGQVQLTVDGLSQTVTISPSTPGVVNATITLPSTIRAGSYTIEASYSDSDSLYASSSGAGTLTISPANSAVSVTTTNSPITYNSGSETLDLTANVTSSNGGTVGEGDVVFTVNGVSSSPFAVSGGTVSGTLTLTGTSVLNAGSYPTDVSVSYADSTNDYAQASATGDLDIATATTTITAAANSTFNTTAQEVTLSATVASPSGGTVNEGAVAFTVLNPYGANLTATANVSGGSASTTVLLPAEFIAGTYSLSASYADSSDANYGPSTTATPGTLTVSAAPTQTTLLTSAVNSTYNSNSAQTITLSAAVTSANIGHVDEGFVTFAVQGTNLTATGFVQDGQATATLTIPAGLAADTYSFTASYADTNNTNGAVNYGTSASDAGKLTVNSATVTATPLDIATPISTGPKSQVVTLAANVTSAAGGIVNEGSVTFTVINPNGANLTATGSVSAGTASATLSLPNNFAAGTYVYIAGYSDSKNANGVSNYVASNGAGTVDPPGSATGTFTVVNAPTSNPPAGNPPPSNSAAPPAATPVGSLTAFALGLGPTGIDLFEVDSQGDIFAQGLFGGGLQLVGTSLQLPLVLMGNGGLLAELAAANGQDYFIDVIDPLLPLIEPEVIAALDR